MMHFPFLCCWLIGHNDCLFSEIPMEWKYKYISVHETTITNFWYFALWAIWAIWDAKYTYMRKYRWFLVQSSQSVPQNICKQSVCWFRVWLQSVGGPLAVQESGCLCQKGHKGSSWSSPTPPGFQSASFLCDIISQIECVSHSFRFSLSPLFNQIKSQYGLKILKNLKIYVPYHQALQKIFIIDDISRRAGMGAWRRWSHS